MGVATSLACAIHCAVLPLVMTSLPVFGVNIIENVGFEYLMILLAAGIGSYSLYHGYKKHHHSFLPLLVFAGGIVLLFVKQRFHDFEYWLLPIAVVMIISPM